MAILYTSDLHLGHENILHSRMQFSNIEEHDEFLIKKWNDKVKNNDEVYILGDLSFRSKNPIDFYLKEMKGHKHLIIGNHDGFWMKHCEDLAQYFDSVGTLEKIKYNKKKIILCHYPMLEWSGSRYAKNEGSFLIHGHIHGGRETQTFKFIRENLPHALNAGVDVNNFEPVTFEELRENNKAWYERDEE